MSNIVIQVYINNVLVPVESFDVNIGAFGSIGSAHIVTSRKALTDIGLDLVNAAEMATAPLPVAIYAGSNSANRVQIFSGGYDDATFAFRADTVTIHARDLAAELVDQKFVLTQKYSNQTPDQLATTIAKQFGFTPMITPAPLGADGQPQTIGSLMGVSGSYMSYPRPAWDILQSLARAVGYTCWVTPQRQLFYAPPTENDDPLSFSWNVIPPKNVIPLIDLTGLYAPRRNKTFTVVVLSHHGAQVQLTSGTTVVAGQTIPTPQVEVLKAGVYTAAAGTKVRNLAAGSLEGQPVYVFRKEGLTADQCARLSESIARDIAKHELKIDAICDGLPSLTLLQSLRLQGDVGQFAGKNLYVNSITHSFKMPKAEERAGLSGFTTKFNALSLPPTSISDPGEVTGE